MSDTKRCFVVADDIYAVVSKEEWSKLVSYALDGWFVVNKGVLDQWILDHAREDVRWLFEAFPREFVFGGALTEYVSSHEAEILHYFEDDHNSYIKFWDIFNNDCERMSRDQFNEKLTRRLEKLTDDKLASLADRDAFFDYMMKTMERVICN